MWIHGSGQAEIFDLEDEQTNIRRDESTLPMQTLCFISFISAGAQRPLAARSGLHAIGTEFSIMNFLQNFLNCHFLLEVGLGLL